MVHVDVDVDVDVKKVGRIPDGGGRRAHGEVSDQAEAFERDKTAGSVPDMATCIRRSTGSPALPLPQALRAGRYPQRGFDR